MLTTTKLAKLDAPVANINNLIDALELYTDNVSVLPVDLDLQELQQTDQYTEPLVEDDNLATIPIQYFDPAITEEVLRESNKLDTIPYKRSTNPNLPLRFRTALGLQYEEVGILRT